MNKVISQLEFDDGKGESDSNYQVKAIYNSTFYTKESKRG